MVQTEVNPYQYHQLPRERKNLLKMYNNHFSSAHSPTMWGYYWSRREEEDVYFIMKRLSSSLMLLCSPRDYCALLPAKKEAE